MSLLLAFDTATSQVTVALAEGGEVLAERAGDPRDRQMKHGELLAPLIAETLAATGAGRRDLAAVAVGVGPGPFTGLRVGLVTARTLGYVLDIPVYGVCTLDVVAVEAVATGAVGDAAGEGSPFAVATDARRKEVYLASYTAAGVRLGPAVVARPEAVATDSLVVGEGALLYPEAFPHSGGPQRPSAGWLARAVAGEQVALLAPEPLYLRRPDAVATADRAAAPATMAPAESGR